jgi:hypothetical protein
MQAADYMAAEVEAAKTGNVTIYEGSGRPPVTPAIRQYFSEPSNVSTCDIFPVPVTKKMAWPHGNWYQCNYRIATQTEIVCFLEN